MDYRCLIEFKDATDEGKLIMTDDELCCLLAFDQYAIAYADISSVEIVSYQLVVQTAYGVLRALKLGANLTPAYLEILEKYNAKVRKSLFVETPPILRTKGEYRYRDDGGTSSGKAEIELYERCLLILPPNDFGRRIPLCFVRAIDKGNYVHTLTLDTGETYEILRLGLDTEPFDHKLNECMLALRQNAVNAAIQTDPSLDAMQSARIARLMPEGVAAPLGELGAVSPSFPAALEAKIQLSKAAETYPYFRQICDPQKILIGFKSYLAGDEQKDVLWIISPKLSDGGGMAALEVAVSEDVAAATYLYRFTGDWESFYKRLNHAIEAIEFHREVIFLPEEELCKREKAQYRMTIRRTPSLNFLRGCFANRVIHASPESWKADLDKRFVQ